MNRTVLILGASGRFGRNAAQAFNSAGWAVRRYDRAQGDLVRAAWGADVIVNAADAGNGFPWHFDTNNFTVTLALQNAESGGAFEYAPMIRSSADENFAEVSRVLNGTSDKVISLELEPGDLQLFKGRYSLHRVAPLAGDTARYVAIFSYVEAPGMVGSVERTRQLYGRTLPIHHEREGHRADALID